MNKILSLIIPSYNMERYLHQCLSSLIVDNLEDVEVLVVNDGSKDKTLNIATEYQKKYPISIKVIDKENGNYGSCINRALKEATGKYIKVLDADDSFDPKIFSRFVNFLKDTDADLVISDYMMVYETGKVKTIHSFHHRSKQNNLYNIEECLEEISQEKFQMHAVTYKTSILKEIDYHQTEGISYTDQEWMFRPMAYINSISFFSGCLYRYLIGREGQTVDLTVSTRAVGQTATVVKSMLVTFQSLKEEIDSHKRNYLLARLWQKIPSIYRICLLKAPSEENYKLLQNFDRDFLSLDNELYQDIAKESLGGVPFRYVRYWRNRTRKQLPMPLLTIASKLVKMIKG